MTPDPRFPSVEEGVYFRDDARGGNGVVGGEDGVRVSIGSVIATLANEWGFPVELLVGVAVKYGVEHLPEALAEHTRSALDQG